MDAWFWFPSAGVYFYFSKNRRALVSLGNLMCSRFSWRVGTAVFICGRTSSALRFCLCDAQSLSAVVSQSSQFPHKQATLLHDRSRLKQRRLLPAFFCFQHLRHKVKATSSWIHHWVSNQEVMKRNIKVVHSLPQFIIIIVIIAALSPRCARTSALI